MITDERWNAILEAAEKGSTNAQKLALASALNPSRSAQAITEGLVGITAAIYTLATVIRDGQKEAK